MESKELLILPEDESGINTIAALLGSCDDLRLRDALLLYAISANVKKLLRLILRELKYTSRKPAEMNRRLRGLKE
ncbi:hypothetical protein RQN30_00380 [Arcanobacterium hippocoleae]